MLSSLSLPVTQQSLVRKGQLLGSDDHRLATRSAPRLALQPLARGSLNHCSPVITAGRRQVTAWVVPRPRNHGVVL